MAMPLGKLPPDALARLLQRIDVRDPRVIVGSGPGIDAAVLELGDRYLIATSDPITLVSARAGWYAVHVNANDIAVMGGTPRWLLATVMLPPQADEALLMALHEDTLAACADLGVTLIGGHTEVTDAVDRPVIAGTMLGEAAKDRLVTSAGARAGDIVLIAGGIAIEGTAALAGEATVRERLAGRADIDAGLLNHAAALLFQPGISVVRAARALCDAARPHAMHDATEGGLATALREMAAASGAGLWVQERRIPVLTATRALCAALDLDPLGLLASGCLIAAVAPEDVAAALGALAAVGVMAAEIGRVTRPEEGLRLATEGGERPLPAFARDELARLLDGDSRPSADRHAR